MSHIFERKKTSTYIVKLRSQRLKWQGITAIYNKGIVATYCLKLEASYSQIANDNNNYINIFNLCAPNYNKFYVSIVHPFHVRSKKPIEVHKITLGNSVLSKTILILQNIILIDWNQLSWFVYTEDRNNLHTIFKSPNTINVGYFLASRCH